ncbi:MAG: hypothetical protein EOP45_03490 [Sphingobacteriaceae bacterium]|nr:MAG: hypothetical protein EOP45_03490 [Sphingobacteriaceae bacterium]
MKILITLYFALFFLLTSCASLTKTQVKSVNNYSQLLQEYSFYPSAIFKEIGEIKYQAEQLNSANTLPKAMYSNLITTYKGKKRFLEQAEKLDLSINVIAIYALGLKKLSSSNLSETLDTASTKLGTNIDGLIKNYNSKSSSPNQLPTNFGALISKGIIFLGSTYTKAQQAKEIKDYVAKGVSPVNALTNSIRESLDELILNESHGSITTTDLELTTNYNAFLETVYEQKNYNIFR